MNLSKISIGDIVTYVILGKKFQGKVKNIYSEGKIKKVLINVGGETIWLSPKEIFPKDV